MLMLQPPPSSATLTRGAQAQAQFSCAQRDSLANSLSHASQLDRQGLRIRYVHTLSVLVMLIAPPVDAEWLISDKERFA